jgi:hypothetical protein
MSSVWFAGSNSVDNNFDTFTRTNATEVPWLNIQLAELVIIKSVVIIMRIDCCFNRIGIASITVGNNPDPNLNSVCKANIDRGGIFACTTPLEGLYVGLTRIAIGVSDSNIYHFSEI